MEYGLYNHVSPKCPGTSLDQLLYLSELLILFILFYAHPSHICFSTSLHYILSKYKCFSINSSKEEMKIAYFWTNAALALLWTASQSLLLTAMRVLWTLPRPELRPNGKLVWSTWNWRWQLWFSCYLQSVKSTPEVLNYWPMDWLTCRAPHELRNLAVGE